MHRMAVLLGALALAVAPGHAATTYKWTDDSGRVHYASQPPEGVDARELTVPGPTGNGDDGGAAGSTTTAAGDGTTGEAPAGEKPRGTPDEQWMARQCAGARDNLELFTNASTNQRFRRADGTIVRYSEEELAAERREAQAFLDEYCTDRASAEPST